MNRSLKLLLAIVILCGAFGLLGYTLVGMGIIGKAPRVAPLPQRKLVVTIHAPSPRQLHIEDIYKHLRGVQDYTSELEKKCLAEFESKNPPGAAYASDAKQAIQFYLCWLTGGDFYGEGLLQEAEILSHQAYEKGCRDPLILTICDVYTGQKYNSAEIKFAKDKSDNMRMLLKSDYPTLCKLASALMVVKDTAGFRNNKSCWKDDMSPAVNDLPNQVDLMREQFTVLASSICPGQIINRQVNMMLETLDQNPDVMEKIAETFKASFSDAHISENTRAYGLGAFFTSWAWTARGNGFAETVTEQGWRVFKERLDLAQKVLEPAVEKFPNDPALPTEMITVELGQGQETGRMDLYFQRAIKANPDFFRAYSKKMWYLEPRWYGSTEEVLNFGAECIKTKNWDSKIPMVMIEGIEALNCENENIYQNEQYWNLVDYLFKEYLSRYPNSIGYRTDYFEWAVKGKHWDIAKAQAKILGSNWDHLKLYDNEYRQLLFAIPSDKS